MAKYTPMIEQYLAIKAEVPDAFLFFRLGDFYEMFFEDALKAARELEITLTGREGGAEEKIPMCGVPYHSADTYIARLIEKGFKVAICEQIEDPAEAKGVVKREIVRIITPGTVMDSRSLNESGNNYIAAVVFINGGYVLAAADISTGELHTARLEGGTELLADELSVYNPSEVLGPGALLEQLQLGTQSWLGSAVMTPRELPASPLEDAWTDQFAPGEFASLPSGGKEAVSLLMNYLYETQKRSLMHIKRIRSYETSQYMIMDPFTRRNLELVETVRDRARQGSLLWLLDKTETAMGGRLLKRWIEKPLMNESLINERLEAVERLVHQFIVREDLKESLREVYDLERLTARIAYGSANARDLVSLRASLQQVPRLKELCEDSGSSTLKRTAERMDESSDLVDLIAAAIVDEPPVSVRDGGMIRDGYHDRLDQLREASTNGKQWLAELERSERERTGIKSLKIGFNKVFGYYIEVSKANLSLLEEGRYERKQTLANAERFVTPELKEKEALILEAEDHMVDLEYKLFTQLREQLAVHVSRLQLLAELIAAVDVYQSLARVSADNRYAKPEISNGYGLQIAEGKHPVVEAVLADGVFIANDCVMTKEDGSMLLITGPNMAGKSTYMRQVAMICIMAQIGCFVPARSAKVPVIDRIFTRIGAADDLAGGQSTFMVEMTDIRHMTEKATDRSLVIIDELGRGTSTGEGMAIAQAVIEYLHHKVGCKTLVSTHFHELAHLEESLLQLRNYCMAVKESGREVTFLRRLISGAASTSYGIYCAQIAGLPAEVIDRSYELLHSFEARAALAASKEQTATASITSSQSVMEEKSTWPVEPSSHSSVSGEEPGSNTEAEQTQAYQEAQVHQEAQPQQGALAQQAYLQSQSAPSESGDAVNLQDGVIQLSLFESGNSENRSKRKADVKAEQALEKLRTADLMNMTPMAAMNFLYELKKQLS